MKFSISVLLLLIVLAAAPVLADAVCPPKVVLSLARSGSACFGQERYQACYGNGSVESTFYTSKHADFAKPGDRIALSDLQQVHVQPLEGDISVATLYAQANLTDAEQRSVVFFLFGDAQLDNLVPPLPQMVVAARGALNIRRTPDDNGDIVKKMAVNETVIANGRSDDSNWLRVKVPNSNDLGWVSAKVVTADGNILTLAVVTVDSPVYRPFQIATLKTTSTALCSGALDSGLLLQTPNLFTPIEMSLNGVQMRLSGTFFIQAAGTLTVNVLDGQAELTVQGVTQFVPAGARAQIPLGADNTASAAPAVAEPYAVPVALPVNNLPYPVTVAAPLTQDALNQALANHAAIVEATPQPEATSVPDTTCRRIVKRTTTLWAGPGTYYEAINDLPPGTYVDPVLQTTDPDKRVWWQLRNSNWVRADAVEQTGECDDVPIATVITPPPDNNLPLETCESRNGPVRVGQQVRIHFTPPPFDGYEAAEYAQDVDPGFVTIDNETYYTYATEPIRLGTVEEKYIREFYIVWTAEAGTHRIVGKRLSYQLICNLTVPTG